MGAFKFAPSTTPPCATSRHISATTSGPRPMTAAMAPAPTATASCINSPRRRTARSASSTLKEPAATRAVYSPRLGVRRQAQGPVRALEAQRLQIAPETLPPRRHKGPRGRKALRQVATHANILGPLAGKNECCPSSPQLPPADPPLRYRPGPPSPPDRGRSPGKTPSKRRQEDQVSVVNLSRPDRLIEG